jgi:hypothetical protein
VSAVERLSAKQKMLSLRPRRLCGEISILDNNDFVPLKALLSNASKMVDFFFAL